MKRAWISLLLLLGLAACAPSPAAVRPWPPISRRRALAHWHIQTRLPCLRRPQRHPEPIACPRLPQGWKKPSTSPGVILRPACRSNSSQIGLVNTMDITWADILAGCTSTAPQVLTQGRVYGYRVTLEAGGADYIYHVGETGQVILCTQPAPGANNPLLGGSNGPTQDPYNNAP